MKKIIVLLCLGLMGCATVAKESKPSPRVIKELTVVDEKEMDKAISVFSETIKNTPDYAGAYYNRAIAYFYKKSYDQSWQDVHKAQSLGYQFKADFIESLKKASKREK
jgi:tetratricopeptide (TPR) repeat protein